MVGLRDYIEGRAIYYDDFMTWGSFYCFVAAESSEAQTVLLHGAVDIPSDERRHQRKSVELRFLV